MIILLIIVVSSIFSIIAAYKLHKNSDYVTLYKRTKKFCCFDTVPVVHHSLIFKFAENDDNHNELEEYLLTQTTRNMMNRTRGGETTLHIASRSKAHKCTKVLILAGAEIKENSKGVLPNLSDVLQDPDIIKKLSESSVSITTLIKLMTQMKNSAGNYLLEEASRSTFDDLVDLVKDFSHSSTKCVFLGDGYVG